MDETEEWRPVAGHEDRYLVSNLGRVWSVRRQKHVASGGGNYLRVVLYPSKKQVSIHRLVAEAFIPNPEEFPIVRHLNDVRTDNRVVNLAWGTPRDNGEDAVRNGKYPNGFKTHCPRGHEYTEENTIRWHKERTTSRVCRQCMRLHDKKRYGTPLEASSPLHGTWTGYNRHKCRCVPCLEEGHRRNKKYNDKKRGKA